MFGSLGAGITLDFEKIRDGIDCSEGFEQERDFIDGDVPRANTVNMDFGPGSDRSIARSQMAVLLGRNADLRTYGTGRKNATDFRAKTRVPKIATEQLFQTIHASSMNGDFMVPNNERFEHVGWHNDMPRRCGIGIRTNANDLVATERLSEKATGKLSELLL